MRTPRGEEDRSRLAGRLVGQRITGVTFLFTDSDTLALVTDKGLVVPVTSRMPIWRTGPGEERDEG